jgi:hypothetical protein
VIPGAAPNIQQSFQFAMCGDISSLVGVSALILDAVFVSM